MIKKINYLHHCFLHSIKGGVIVPFAIAFPVLLSFVSLGLDSSYVLNKKTNFYRAVNESLLAVSAQDSRKNDHPDALELASAYFSAYLPELKNSNKLTVKVAFKDQLSDQNEPHVFYQLNANALLNVLFPLKRADMISFNEQVKVKSDNGNKIKKFISKEKGTNFDIALIADYSGSMGWAFDDSSYSPKYTDTRIWALKEVVKAIMNNLTGTEHQITYVPWGLTTYYQRTSGRIVTVGTSTIIGTDSNDYYASSIRNTTLKRVLSLDKDEGFWMFRPKNIYDRPQHYYLNYYTIPLTKNDQEKKEALEKILKMRPTGGTNSLSGLMRAIPELAQGKNEGKLLIILSDGDDFSYHHICQLHTNKPSQFVSWGNDQCRVTSTTAIGDAKLCDVIRAGFQSEDLKQQKVIARVSTQVDIHYVSIGRSGQHAKRERFWRDHCVGEGNVHTADNYQELLDILNTIITRTTETGYISLQ